MFEKTIICGIDKKSHQWQGNNFQMKHSCNNIFLRLVKWKRGKSPRKKDDEKKCQFVIETSNELQDAVELGYKLYNKKDTSSQADSSFLTARRII